jgi:hypothetical protein
MYLIPTDQKGKPGLVHPAPFCTAWRAPRGTHSGKEGGIGGQATFGRQGLDCLMGV